MESDPVSFSVEYHRSGPVRSNGVRRLQYFPTVLHDCVDSCFELSIAVEEVEKRTIRRGFHIRGDDQAAADVAPLVWQHAEHSAG